VQHHSFNLKNNSGSNETIEALVEDINDEHITRQAGKKNSSYHPLTI
ncbi:hypothetical protein THOM_2934, partial [Trachipleistophora hominis]